MTLFSDKRRGNNGSPVGLSETAVRNKLTKLEAVFTIVVLGAFYAAIGYGIWLAVTS